MQNFVLKFKGIVFASRLADSKRIVLLQIVSKPTDPDSDYVITNKKIKSPFRILSAI